MKGADAAAAEAFVEYYLEQAATWAVSSGDTGQMKRFAAPVCGACAGFAGAVDEVYRLGGGDVQGGALTVEKLNLVHRGPLGEGTVLFVAQATVLIGEQTISGAGAAWDGQDPATRVRYEIQVSHHPTAGWLMLEFAEK